VNFITDAKGSIVKMIGERNHQSLTEFIEEESGQDLIEYVLLVSVLSLFAIAGVQGVAANVLSMWHTLATGFTSAL
jgi:Flp pilus assembly pilin Flp